MLFATACSQDTYTETLTGGESVVSFTAELPSALTTSRADFGDGTTATTLSYAIYEAGQKTPLIVGNDAVTFTGLKATFGVSLVNGRSYDIIFWADAPNSIYTFDAATQSVTANYAKANQESYDAFFADTTIAVNGAAQQPIELYRPFAQLNIGTNDTQDAATAGLTVTETQISVKAYKTLNLITGEVSDETDLTYAMSAIPTGDEYPVTGHNYLAMNYILVPVDATTYDVTFTTYEGQTAVNTRTYTAVPLERNYKTNIYGRLLTSTTDFNVEIKPAFVSENFERWDGTTITAPRYDATTNTYYVINGEQLAWIAEAMNTGVQPASSRTSTPFNRGANIVLDACIDLGGHEWTPIGINLDKAFCGSFDGQENIISNFKVTTATGVAGLFGIIRGTGTVKNLVIDNITVKSAVTSGDENFYAGGLAGVIYGTHTFSNITVQNSSIEGSAKSGGLFGFNGDCAQVITDCHIIKTTVASANPEDGGNIGGLVGFLQCVGGGSTVHDFVISNCTIEEVTVNAYQSRNDGSRANSLLLGAFNGKGATDWSLTIENCKIDDESELNILTDGITYVSQYGELVGGNRYEQNDATVTIDGEVIPFKSQDLVKSEIFAEQIAEGGEITLTNDMVLTYGVDVVIPAGVTTTLNLNGKTITTEGSAKGANIQNYGTLNVVGGTIVGNEARDGRYCIYNGAGGVLTVDGTSFVQKHLVGGGAIFSEGTAIINDATIDAQTATLWNRNGKMTINGGTFNSNGITVVDGVTNYNYSVRTDNGGKTTINGGTFNSNRGVLHTSGDGSTLEVYDGTFKASTGNTTGYTVYLGSTTSKATIYGGKYASEGNEAICFGSYGELYIYGGMINRTNGNWGIKNSVTWGDSGDTDYPLTPVMPAYTEPSELKAALSSAKEGETVVMTGDVEGSASKGGYSKAGVTVSGGATLDGAGNTLKVEDANGTWDCGVYAGGGTIKNVTINGSFRGIFTAGCSSDIIIDNVILDKVCYTFSADDGNKQNSLIVTNTILNGWTSYGNVFKSVSFTDCKFGKGTGDYQYAYCRPYNATTFTNCEFEPGYEFDSLRTTSTFINCTCGGVLITKDNVVELLGEDAGNIVFE